jgi:hypothetical protein
MKKMFVVLVVFMACSIVQADVNDVNTLTLEQCRARILELERIVRSQQDRIEKLIARLKNQTGRSQDVNAPKVSDAKKSHIIPPFDPNNGIVYNGKKRDMQWFNYFYKENQNEIAFVDDKYTYITGGLKRRQGEVLQVLDNGEAIICQKGRKGFKSSMIGSSGGRDGGDLWERIQTGAASTPSTPDIFYHIKGYKGSLVDGQSFSCNAISNGTFEYIDTTGAQRTIKSFIVCEPLTKEQFADALNSGFILMKQTKNDNKPAESPTGRPLPKTNGENVETPIQ